MKKLNYDEIFKKKKDGKEDLKKKKVSVIYNLQLILRDTEVNKNSKENKRRVWRANNSKEVKR